MGKNRLEIYLKLGILLFGVSLLTTNCEKDDQLTFDSTKNINAKTVTFDEAKVFFENKNSNVFAQRTSGNALILDPDWNSLERSELTYTEAQLTKASTEVNRDGEFTSKLLFVNINGDIKSVILTTWVEDYNAQNNIVNANIYLNEYDGTFIDAYKIENGLFTKRLKPKHNIQTASFYMLFQEKEEDDCWNTDNLPEGGQLDDVDLGIIESGGSSGGYSGANYSGVSYGDLINNGVSSGGGLVTGGGGTSITNGGVDIGAATIIMNPPIEPDEEGNCPPGYTKDPVTDKCISICNGGKDYNATTKECECTDGKVEDDNGNCVEKPCEGDPVSNPEITSSGKSGKRGGTFSCTRTANTTCEGVFGKKNHDGLDIRANVNKNAYAMYSGTISSIRNTFNPGQYKKNSYGNFVVITTVINGVTHNIKYNHLNSVSVTQGQTINTGDIIGLTGNTGNAADPDVIPHIHLQAFNSNWSQSLDPEDLLTTKFDSNYNPISNNCQ